MFFVETFFLLEVLNLVKVFVLKVSINCKIMGLIIQNNKTNPKPVKTLIYFWGAVYVLNLKVQNYKKKAHTNFISIKHNFYYITTCTLCELGNHFFLTFYTARVNQTA